MHGSEGGESGQTGLPYPYQKRAARAVTLQTTCLLFLWSQSDVSVVALGREPSGLADHRPHRCVIHAGRLAPLRYKRERLAPLRYKAGGSRRFDELPEQSTRFARLFMFLVKLDVFCFSQFSRNFVRDDPEQAISFKLALPW